jgi:hypothetical protein
VTTKLPGYIDLPQHSPAIHLPEAVHFDDEPLTGRHIVAQESVSERTSAKPLPYAKVIDGAALSRHTLSGLMLRANLLQQTLPETHIREAQLAGVES